MAELKSCPFCGLLPKVYKSSKARGEREEGFFTNQPVFVVWCQYKFCDVQPCTREYMAREEAVRAWNTRIKPIIPDDNTLQKEENKHEKLLRREDAINDWNTRTLKERGGEK